MNTRELGRTGLEVSEIGYGAWGIAGDWWVGATDAESLRALHRAVDLGVTFVDTALGYGRGHSESLVGRVVRERREAVHVATKVPPKNRLWPARAGVPVSECFPPEWILRSCESSLRNLGMERVDLLQLHTWQDEYLDQDGWSDALLGLKASGKVRFLGISVNDHDPASALRAVASGVFDTVQVIYNIFDQSPEAELFPACVRHGVGVIARVPLDEGGLTGTITPSTGFAEGDFRVRYFRDGRKREVFARGQALATLLGDEAQSLPELALRFCLAHDAVSTVIPGMRRVATVEANCAVADGRRLSPALRQALKAHAWNRNFYE
ncbi:MAG: aldo/keto reductase [Acidobacteria bacterium]|nr:aldo/keto reductase [Acidobacteriota bacterium]